MGNDEITMLMESAKKIGRDEVYEEIEKAFRSDDEFKGRIWFDEADDLIQTIKLRIKRKSNAS